MSNKKFSPATPTFDTTVALEDYKRSQKKFIGLYFQNQKSKLVEINLGKTDTFIKWVFSP